MVMILLVRHGENEWVKEHKLAGNPPFLAIEITRNSAIEDKNFETLSNVLFAS